MYKLLETKAGLKKLYLQVQNDEGHHMQTFVFVSEDYLTNQDKLLILIHGSGVVRAGQWARRLVIQVNHTRLDYLTDILFSQVNHE